MSDAPEDIPCKPTAGIGHVDVDLSKVVVSRDSVTIHSILRKSCRNPEVRSFEEADCALFVSMLQAALASVPEFLRRNMRVKRTANLTDKTKMSDELIYLRGTILVRRIQTRFDYGPGLTLRAGIKREYGDDLKQAGWRPSHKETYWYAPTYIFQLMPIRVASPATPSYTQPGR